VHPGTPPPIAGLLRAPGPGAPLPASVARPIESGLAVDTGAVRVHSGPRAAAAADLIGARAFAWGSGVFLGTGQAPTDLRLMAHEVAHVVQQQAGPAVQLFSSDSADPLEREAQAAATAVVAGGRAAVVGRTGAPRLQGDWIPGFVRRAAGAVSSGLQAVAGAAGDLLAAARARVMGFIRDKARILPGYDLLAFALGRDPVTQDPVARTATNLIKAVLGLIPGGAALFENLQGAGVIQRAFEWVSAETAKLGLTWQAFKALLAQVWDSLSLGDLASPGAAWERLKAVFGPPLGRLVAFAGAAGRRLLELVFEGALALGGGAAQRVLDIFRRVGDAFGLIVSDPVGFLRNLLAAVKGGFQRFVANIVEHLKTALFQWLTGAFAGAIRLPERWDLRGIVSVVLQVLGLTYDRMREKLVKLVGEPAVRGIETAFEFLRTVVVGGLAAAWEKLVEFASGLVDTVIGGIRDWVAKSVIGAAVTKLVTLFNPVGAIIQGIITIYNTVMFFIERAKQIAALVESIVDSISSIARGSIGAAVARVETTMARTLPVIIGFLARLIGLGNVTGAVKGIIEKIQGVVSGAIDKVVAWIVERAKGIIARLAGKDERTPGEKERAGKDAAAEADRLLNVAKLPLPEIARQLPGLRRKYRLTSLELRSESAPSGGALVYVEATINPKFPTKKRAEDAVRWPPNLGDLRWHEDKGGHLIRQHIDQSQDDLFNRRLVEFADGTAPASRWQGPGTAANIITTVCMGSKTAINNWILKGRPEGNLPLHYVGAPGDPLGDGYRRGEAVLTPMHNARIVLRHDGAGGWFVLTGFPEP
jgi:hypothetical protein